MGHSQNDTGQEKLKKKNKLPKEKPATLSTTNPIKTGLGLNMSLSGGRPVTNHMSHGMACVVMY